MPLPESPSTLSELLPHLPLPHEYASKYAMIFQEELKDRLLAIQAENPDRFFANPVRLQNETWMLCADLLSEVPNGLYGKGFQQLDSSRFNEIQIVLREDIQNLLPQVDPSIFN